ncbi:MAG TPA: thioredoxin domain-containing protein [Nakamurella sp.]|nr:thioredoxin domain-containing protein [Nakamurella sp.]
MAQRGRKQSSQVPGMVSGGSRSGGSGGGRPGQGKPGGKAPSGKVPSGKARSGARQSIAAARRSSGDRTQLIIGGVAVVVIIAIIAVGLVLYNKNSAVPESGYGVSTASTASVDDSGIITVSNGSPDLVLDIYEDGLCPVCGHFEGQFGEQISKAIDQGQLTVRYHMVDFLNSRSHSGDYSTRAYAALMAVAKGDGEKPGVFMQFHSALFDSKNQPVENGSSDLSNAQLASLAGANGASKTTQEQVSGGAEVQAASADAQSNLQKLSAVAAKSGQNPGTPTVVKDGTPVQINDVDWLTKLLPAGSADSSAPSSGG